MDTTPFQQALEKEYAELEAQLKSLGTRDPNVPEDWVSNTGEAIGTEADENVAADRTEDWLERRGELELLETRFQNVRRALEKIKNGTYGICEISGEPIELDRLQANPAARTSKAHLNDEADLIS